MTVPSSIYAGLEHCTVNVHLQTHFTHFVRLFGPLWTHSSFPFEDCIGHLVRKSHGTHHIAKQVKLLLISECLSMIMDLPIYYGTCRLFYYSCSLPSHTAI